MILLAFLLLPCIVFNLQASYIDPGTGSYIIQMIIAAIFGGLFFIKLWWKQLTSYFSKNKKTSNDHNDYAK